MIADLESLVADTIWAFFHPMLPLLTVTCHTYSKAGRKDIAEAVEVMEVDLEALESYPIAHSKYAHLGR